MKLAFELKRTELVLCIEGDPQRTAATTGNGRTIDDRPVPRLVEIGALLISAFGEPAVDVYDERAVTVVDAAVADRTHHVSQTPSVPFAHFPAIVEPPCAARRRNSADYVATTARGLSHAYPRRVVRTGVRSRDGLAHLLDCGCRYGVEPFDVRV